MPNLPPLEGTTELEASATAGSEGVTGAPVPAQEAALSPENAPDAVPPPLGAASDQPPPPKGRSHENERDAATQALLSKSDSTPGPGNYLWKDDVNLRKRPVWSVGSPERKHLDLLLCTWTPASTSLQPRAPDPGEYGDTSYVGYRGKYGAPKWSWENGGTRPCLQPLPIPKMELAIKLPPAVGGSHPTKNSAANWSVFGISRKGLPAGSASWTPQLASDEKPGPGTYKLDRVGRGWKGNNWKVTTRRGCTWGGRIQNLHPDEKAWVPKTRGARMSGGLEASRFRKSVEPSTRCGCLVCPGPGHCDSKL